ncbi:MAG: hypothetical protein AAGA30_07925 [Planctomycetota bacterium]
MSTVAENSNHIEAVQGYAIGRFASLSSVAFWMICVGLFAMVLIRYEYQSEPVIVPSQWPSQSQINRMPDAYELVLFLHPKCVCSYATLDQLTKILPANREHLNFTLSVYCPKSRDSQWSQTDLTESFQALFPSQVVIDHENREASCFGVNCSGHLVLYDPDGSLLFSGGITKSRGHRGDCIAAETLKKTILEKNTGPFSYPAFGCKLGSTLLTGTSS